MAERMENMSDNPKFNSAFDKLYQFVRAATQAAVTSTATNAPEAICIAMATVTAGLSTLSMLIAPNGVTQPDEDTVLFAAILTALTAPSCGKDTVQFGFAPDVVFEALEMFERATGRKPDKSLLAAMVQAARTVGEHGEKPLAQFMETRAKQAPSTGTIQ